MEKLWSVQDIMERYQMNARSARKVMGEIGITHIAHRAYVRETALEAYEFDRTDSTYYSKPEKSAALIQKGRKKNDRVSRKKGVQVGFDEEVS